ncbi:MAG: hypothetical protein GYA55_12585 [SAR324 cluster bacterium]|uniref:Uncharacterized protein n=1 Tax=SAR324 cluster bacterium TaxID=2024889 RepID=A0A7X9FTE3_9DELT|nr:hypothetical protein [SAR324 cluster bacterium]
MSKARGRSRKYLKFRGLRLLSFGLVFFVFLILVLRAIEKNYSHDEDRVIETISGRELAKEAFKFLVVLHRPELVIEGTKCASNDNCSAIKSINPVAAITWEMLGNAKQYEVTKDSEHLENISKLFSLFRRLPPSPYTPTRLEVNFSQLIDAFKASKNLDILKLITYHLQDIRTNVNTKGPLPYVSRGIMVSSLIAGALVDFYALSNSSEVYEFLKTSWLPKRYTEAEVQQYRDSYRIAAKKIIDELRPSEELRVGALQEVLPMNQQDFSCFIQLAKSKYYLATKEPEILNDLSYYFEEADFKSKRADEFKFNVIQPALACAETLKNILPLRPQLSEDLHELISKFIISRFDYEKRPICIGDNGFLGTMGKGFSCEGATKLISDSAWAVSILSDLEMRFDVSARRISEGK